MAGFFNTFVFHSAILQRSLEQSRSAHGLASTAGVSYDWRTYRAGFFLRLWLTLMKFPSIASTTYLCFVLLLPSPASAGFLDDLSSSAGKIVDRAQEKAKRLKDKYTSNRIDGSFEDLYPTPFFRTTVGKFALIGGSAVVVAGVTYFTAGGGLASAGPIATWVGTQVGMATGVGSGATAAGLALLGGGSIASGGFGIAGGLAVISAISDIGIATTLTLVEEKIPDYELANQKYRLLKIPLPEKASDPVLSQIKKAEAWIAELNDEGRDQSRDAEKRNKARKHYVNALALLQSIDSNSKNAGYDYIVKAILEYNFMQYSDARQSIKEASRFTRNDAFVVYVLTLIRLTQSNSNTLDEAAQWLDQVTEVDPTAIQPYILKTIVQMDRGQPLIALRGALEGLGHVEDNFELNWRAAEISFHNVEKYQLAGLLYRQALSSVTQNEMEALCKMMTAISYDRLNEKEKAIEWYQDAISEISDQPKEVSKLSALWENLTE